MSTVRLQGASALPLTSVHQLSGTHRPQNPRRVSLPPRAAYSVAQRRTMLHASSGLARHHLILEDDTPLCPGSLPTILYLIR